MTPAIQETPTRNSLARKVCRALLYLTYVVAVVLLAVYFIFHRPFVGKLRERNRPSAGSPTTARYVDQETARILGHLQADKRSSFVNFSKEKKRGVRLCAFGDSHTHGDETAEEHDYPSFLQQLFDAGPSADVEVINFGSPWHGFHQAYMMWDLVGRGFDCDTILLGPSCFQSQRDTTFSHTNLASPYYLHSRYVLEGEDVKRVDILGETYVERFEHYYRLIPHWRYLRYDRGPPALMQSIIGEGKTAPNPFYYHRAGRDEEINRTYEILLGKMADSGRRIVLLHYRDPVVALAKSLGRDNLFAGRITSQPEFPYVAREGHSSAMGNRLVAERFYAHLASSARPAPTGLEPTVLEHTVLESTDLSVVAAGTPEGPTRSLASFDRVEVRVGESAIGAFVSADRTRSLDLKGTTIDSYLAIKAPGLTAVDAFFLPLSFSLAEGANVMLRVRRGAGDDQRYRLGRVRKFDSRLNLGVIEIPGLQLEKQWRSTRLWFRGDKSLPLRRLPRTGAEIQLLVDGKPVMSGRWQEQRLLLEPLAGNLFHQLRSVEGQVLDLDQLPATGTYDLVLHHPEDGVLRIPIARWRKTTLEQP